MRHPGMDRAAVVINEFGDVPLDHELIAASTERTALLANGCLCCTLRTDLQETLRDLYAQRRAGEVIDFDRVFVETTGLADPVPVLHSLQTDGFLGAQFRLNGVVTLVDAVNGSGQLDREPEAVKQAAVADRLVVTKTDLVDAARREALMDRLARLNPYARMATAVAGDLDPRFLADIAPASVAAGDDELDRWLPRAAAALAQSPQARLFERPMGAAGPHDARVRAFCLRFEEPFTWDGLHAVLETLAALRGPDLLRMKGIVRVAGEPAPVVVQGAQHVFHEPVRLAARGMVEPGSRIVFIVRDIAPEAIRALFAAVAALAP
ncbi:MAG TPA: GTP-binding protein [Usitatibacter sp.]|nr:GTP-binding protein [Usitatibacter sp.]